MCQLSDSITGTSVKIWQGIQLYNKYLSFHQNLRCLIKDKPTSTLPVIPQPYPHSLKPPVHAKNSVLTETDIAIHNEIVLKMVAWRC